MTQILPTTGIVWSELTLNWRVPSGKCHLLIKKLVIFLIQVHFLKVKKRFFITERRFGTICSYARLHKAVKWFDVLPCVFVLASFFTLKIETERKQSRAVKLSNARTHIDSQVPVVLMTCEIYIGCLVTVILLYYEANL